MKVEKEIFGLTSLILMLVLVLSGICLSMKSCIEERKDKKDRVEVSPEVLVDAEVKSNEANMAREVEEVNNNDINKEKKLIFEEGPVRVYRFKAEYSYKYVVISSNVNYSVGIK